MRINVAKLVTIFSFALLLHGCATTTYSPPEGGSVAHITGVFERNGLFDWSSYAVRAIDGRFLSNPLLGHLAEVRSAVAAGNRRVLVEAKFNRTYGGGGPYQAFIPLQFEFAAGRELRVNGAVRDNVVDAWIEDASSGEKLTGAVSAQFGEVARSPGVVPIIIPRR